MFIFVYFLFLRSVTCIDKIMVFLAKSNPADSGLLIFLM